jgi:hypothetical protein
LLHRHNFNSQTAISEHFNNSSSVRLNTPNRQHTVEQRRELAQYIRHLQRTAQERGVWKAIKTDTASALRRCFRKISGYMMPDCLKQRLFCTKFDRLYKSMSNLSCEASTLKEVLVKGRLNEKPCAILLSSSHKVDRALLGLLNNNELTTLLVIHVLT